MKAGINRTDFATYLFGFSILGIFLSISSFIGISIIRLVRLHQANKLYKIFDFDKGWFYVWNTFMTSLIVFSHLIRNDSNWFAKSYSQYGIIYVLLIVAIFTAPTGLYLSNKPNLF